MRGTLFALALLLGSLTAYAGGGDDFASRYMKLYAKGTSLTCTTVSPTMMSRIMNVAAADNEPHVREVLARLKSLRIVDLKKPDEGDSLYLKAVDLLRQNRNRYQAYGKAGSTAHRNFWFRRKGETVVEIIMIDRPGGEGMNIVDLTGNMDDTFIKELLRL